jgi:hypothetical protein
MNDGGAETQWKVRSTIKIVVKVNQCEGLETIRKVLDEAPSSI